MALAGQLKLSFEHVAKWLEQEDFEAEELIELVADLANGDYDQHELYEDITEAVVN